METNEVTFLSGDGRTVLQGVWHLPTAEATNGALIVLHGSSNTKESQLSVEMCQRAAGIGLTALRFDFRFVPDGDAAKFNPYQEGLEDLLGAYNFIASFGKEMKPKRIYLAGKSLGGLVALAMAQKPEYRAKINGVIIFGLPVHQPGRKRSLLPPDKGELDCYVLILQGERDPYGSLDEVRDYCVEASIPSMIVTIEKAGHSFEPVTLPGEALLEPHEAEERHQVNIYEALLEAMDWLEEEDSDRDNFRI